MAINGWRGGDLANGWRNGWLKAGYTG